MVQKASSFGGTMDVKFIMIFVLLIILIIVALGVNILGGVFQRLESFFIIIYNFLRSVLVSIGFSTGEIINASSNTVADAAKTSIDVTNGAFNDVGNLLKGESIDLAIHTSPSSHAQSRPPPPPEPIPHNQWCFVSKGNCVEVDKNDKCESGKLFPSQAKCLVA